MATGEKWLDLTHINTCDDENLLKECALRQEKLSLCYKNSAASDAHARDCRPQKFSEVRREHFDEAIRIS